ncbi:unnamed protein product [Amoebophrya sp. A25]|nr:unnamed protein product [Amoebophrya sp. A25]|eukprot:GSA25T00003580001.1
MALKMTLFCSHFPAVADYELVENMGLQYAVSSISSRMAATTLHDQHEILKPRSLSSCVPQGDAGYFARHVADRRAISSFYQTVPVATAASDGRGALAAGDFLQSCHARRAKLHTTGVKRSSSSSSSFLLVEKKKSFPLVKNNKPSASSSATSFIEKNPYLSEPGAITGEDLLRAEEPPPARSKIPRPPPKKGWIEDPRGMFVDERKRSPTYGRRYRIPVAIDTDALEEDYLDANGVDKNPRKKANQQREIFHPGATLAEDPYTDEESGLVRRGKKNKEDTGSGRRTTRNNARNGMNNTGDGDEENDGLADEADGSAAPRRGFLSQDASSGGSRRGWFFLPNGPVDDYGQVLNPFSFDVFRSYTKPKPVPSIADQYKGRSDRLIPASGDAAPEPHQMDDTGRGRRQRRSKQGARGAGANQNSGASPQKDGGKGASQGKTGGDEFSEDGFSTSVGDDEEKQWGVAKHFEMTVDPTAPEKAEEPCRLADRCNPNKKVEE